MSKEIELSVPVSVIILWPDDVPFDKDEAIGIANGAAEQRFERDVSMCKPGALHTIWARVITTRLKEARIVNDRP